MFKYLLFLLLFSTNVWAVDLKISQLTADTSPTSDDLIMTVNDPGGTPASRKVTLANIFAAIGSMGTTVPYTIGGTGLTAAADDNVMVGSGIGWQSKAITTCTGTGKAVTYDASSNAFGCNTVLQTVPGSDTYMLFNDGGALGADSGAVYNKTTDSLTLLGTITAQSIVGSGTAAGAYTFAEATANGSNYIKLKAADSRSSDVTIVIDGTDGTTITFPAVTGTLATLDSPTFTTFLKLPQGTGPTVDAAGKIAIDTTNDQLDYYGGAKRVLSYIHSKSFVIDAATSTADYVVWRAPYAVTITAIHVLTTGGTNVIGGLDEGDSNGANIVAVDSDITGTAGTMAADDGTLTNPTIASGGTVNWHTTSVSGTNTSLMVTFEYTIDAT